MNTKRIAKALDVIFSIDTTIDELKFDGKYGSFHIGIDTDIIEVFGGYGERNNKKTMYIEIDNVNNEICIWSSHGELLNIFYTDKNTLNEIIAIITFDIMNNRQKIENRLDY